MDSGLKYVELKEEGAHWNLIRLVGTLTHLRRTLLAVKPNLVHFVYLKNVVTGSLLARSVKSPAIIGTVPGLGSLFAQDRHSYRVLRRIVLACLRMGFRHPNAILALENRDDRNYMVAHRVICEERAVIIPGSGVEIDEILPVQEPLGKPVILCAARMIRDKGILELAEAARLLQERGLDFDLWLAGDRDTGNPSAITLEELKNIEKRGIGKWLGHCDNVARLMELSSIFCLPTYYREGLPRVLAEASAAGLPIVTTDVPGCREVVSHGENGLLVPARDTSALADALQFLLQNREVRLGMRIKSRQVFEEKFTSTRVRATLNQCYAKLSVPLVLRA